MPRGQDPGADPRPWAGSSPRWASVSPEHGDGVWPYGGCEPSHLRWACVCENQEEGAGGSFVSRHFPSFLCAFSSEDKM